MDGQWCGKKVSSDEKFAQIRVLRKRIGRNALVWFGWREFEFVPDIVKKVANPTVVCAGLKLL